METTNTQAAVNNAEFQQTNVEDLNKWYLNETKERYKIKTLEILNSKEVSFSEFIDTQSDETDLARLLWAKQWAMLERQLYMLWLHKEWSEKKENIQAVNNVNFAPNNGKWLTTPLNWPFTKVA